MVQGETEERARIERIVTRIAEGCRPLQMILFESHVWGEPTDGSDIDRLSVQETRRQVIDRWIAIREMIADPGRRIPVEPIVATPEELRRRVAVRDRPFREIGERGKLLSAAC